MKYMIFATCGVLLFSVTGFQAAAQWNPLIEYSKANQKIKEEAGKVTSRMQQHKKDTDEATFSQPEDQQAGSGVDWSVQGKTGAQNRADDEAELRRVRNLLNQNQTRAQGRQQTIDELSAKLKNPKGLSPADLLKMQQEMATARGNLPGDVAAAEAYKQKAKALEDSLAGRRPPPPPPDSTPSPPPNLEGATYTVDDNGRITVLDDEGNASVIPGWIKDPSGNLVREAINSVRPDIPDASGVRPKVPKMPKHPKVAEPHPGRHPSPGGMGGMGAHCFVAGTAVQTPEGPRPIETLRPGDQVLSFNETTREVGPARVLKTITGRRNDLFDLTTENGTITCSSNHRFLTAGHTWVEAQELESTSTLIQLDLRSNRVSREPVHIAPHASSVDRNVYNLTVEKNPNYFVGPDRILCHNIK